MAEQMLRLGNFVTLIHREKQLMNRYFDQEMADQLLFILQDQGVEVVHSAEPQSVRTLPNQQFEVSCSNGESYRCDKILANIGAKPDIELAQGAGLKTGTGILVDHHLLTSHPDVYAAGDVAEHSGHLITGLWHSAEQQGIIAGANAAGENLSFGNLRYRLKIEVFGSYFFSMLPLHGMQLTKEEIIRKGNKYYHLFLNDSRLIGMLSMNDKDRSKLFETAVRNSVRLDEFMSLIE
jgi:pyruvate/2-oxoglutarate dehydrogenase complex dihydrolipoamide dehydrogenase (E3) component